MSQLILKSIGSPLVRFPARPIPKAVAMPDSKAGRMRAAVGGVLEPGGRGNAWATARAVKPSVSVRSMLPAGPMQRRARAVWLTRRIDKYQSNCDAYLVQLLIDPPMRS
jgi:hypothetical protein